MHDHENKTFLEVLETLSESMDNEELEEIAVVAWKIWPRRNSFAFMENFCIPVDW